MAMIIYPHILLSNIRYHNQVETLNKIDKKSNDCSTIQVYAKKPKGDKLEDLGEMKVSHYHLTFLDRQNIDYKYYASEGKTVSIDKNNLTKFIRL